MADRATIHPFTYREYCLLPEDGRIHELIEGDFFVTPVPTTRHQTISRRLQYQLMQQLEEPGHASVFNAPTDLLLDDHNCVQPDLIVVAASNASIITERAIEGVPELVVEILSPSTRERDSYLKKSVYQRFGIPEYWVVSPRPAAVEVFALRGSQYDRVARYGVSDVLRSVGFANLQVELSKVFADELP